MTHASGTTAKLDRAEFGRDWEAWHRARERDLTSPAGFLAITGLYWLGDEPATFPDAPGTWTSTGDVVRVELGDGEQLAFEGEAVESGREFASIPERGGFVVSFPGGRIEIAKRGGQDIARPRRDDADMLVEYAGTPTYLPNPRWRADAIFHAFDEPRPTEVGAAVDDMTHVYEAPGELEFTLRGETFRLTAFPGGADGSLLVLFGDATNGLTTYSALRALSVPAPDVDGRTELDFNRATNMPCAYTDFATCPMPPAGNRLPIGIEAGEKTPLERVRGVVTDAGVMLAPGDVAPAGGSGA
ncbi:MAG: DUF1684 domain-containing protein [Pseudoclavibacter sp.]